MNKFKGIAAIVLAIIGFVGGVIIVGGELVKFRDQRYKEMVARQEARYYDCVYNRHGRWVQIGETAFTCDEIFLRE